MRRQEQRQRLLRNPANGGNADGHDPADDCGSEMFVKLWQSVLRAIFRFVCRNHPNPLKELSNAERNR
jgi:hypothetical protein